MKKRGKEGGENQPTAHEEETFRLAKDTANKTQSNGKIC